jgi:hypothetical protein
MLERSSYRRTASRRGQGFCAWPILWLLLLVVALTGAPGVIGQQRVALALQPVSAQPVIEGGAAITNKHTVSLSFTSTSGAPDQIRWHWGSPPSDTVTDSSGWVSFANVLNVAVPITLLDSASCAPATLYTQVRNASIGLVESPPGHDSIIIDTLIQDTEQVENPHLLHPGAFTAATSAFPADVSGDGASDGDPGYTRDPMFYLAVDGSSDCSGLQTVGVGRDAAHILNPFTIVNNRFVNVLPFSGSPTPGVVTVAVQVQDRAGNIGTTMHALVYDIINPTWNSGTLTVGSADPQATILTRLTFTGMNVFDDMYPGGFWGVWVANSRQQVADPLADTSLFWIPMKVVQPAASFTTTNWSLATGLPASSITPGTYYVYVRVLDGAGNPSNKVDTASIVLNTVSYPSIYLPVAQRYSGSSCQDTVLARYPEIANEVLARKA